MHVLMLSWEYPPRIVGGLGRHVTALARALPRLGARVTVLTAGNEGPEFEEEEGLAVLRVREHNPPALHFAETVAAWNTSLLEGALRLVKEGGPFDVVHAHDWLTAYAGRALKHGLDLPLVATIHATEFGRNGGLHNDLQRHISDIEWWLTFEAWRVICCSRAMEHELRTFFQIPADKIEVIPNGVDLPREPDQGRGGEGPDPEEAAVRSRYAALGEPLVFFIGRLVHEKGVDILLEAFRILLATRPDAALVVAGTGPARDGLIELAGRMGILHRVRFPGHISDEERNTLYRTADAAAFPSRYEPFGIVALEAMAHGTPVVAAGVGGLAEVIEDGRTGLLFPPGDARALAQRIESLLSSETRRSALAREARKVVAERYGWDRIAQRTLGVYLAVARAHADGRAAGPLWPEEAGAAFSGRAALADRARYR